MSTSQSCLLFSLGSDDVDKLVIKSLEMQHLHNLCGSMVDGLYQGQIVRRCWPWYLHYIVASVCLHQGGGEGAIRDVCPHRFLAVRDDPEKFLCSCQPRKIHFEHVLQAADASEIHRVNVCMYGCKSAWPLFGWLDDVDVDVEVDLVHVLTLNTSGIHLVGRGQHVDVGVLASAYGPCWPPCNEKDPSGLVEPNCSRQTVPSPWMAFMPLRYTPYSSTWSKVWQLRISQLCHTTWKRQEGVGVKQLSCCSISSFMITVLMSQTACGSLHAVDRVFV